MKSFCINMVGLFVLSSICSCQQGLIDLEQNNSFLSIPSTICKDELLKLPSSTTTLSENDALLVAALVTRRNDSPLTRSTIDHSITNCETIRDNDGKPAIYAVNLEDGYILVSATTKYVPIIAIVEHGSYDPDSVPTEQRALLQYYIDDMNSNLPDSLLKAFSIEWSQFKEEPSLKKSSFIATRNESDFNDMLEDYILDWEDEGCEVYMLTHQPDDMNDETYQHYCNIARQYRYDDVNYKNHSVITEEYYTSSSVHVGPLLSTTWNQGYPYNSATSGGDLGCTTVAMAQFMRFYEKPSFFAWDLMHNSLSVPDTVTTGFLSTIKDALNGSELMYTIYSKLNNYGYQAHYGLHSNTSYDAILASGKPIIMGGNPSGAIVPDLINGHAWVCDGITYSSWTRKYTLYAWHEFNYMTMVELTYSSSTYQTMTYYHMNWGWGGDQDGWYYTLNSNGLYYNGLGGSKDYSTFRFDIYVDDDLPNE